jgi:phenylacetate-coenzyme A ligase PaaK-like adenylate-forming protein
MGTVFDAWQFSQALSEVAWATSAPPPLLQQRQHQRLGQVLAAARAGSRLYARRLRGLPDGPEALARLTPVDRHELMDRYADWVTDPALVLDELRAFTADADRIGEPFLGRYLVWESSGTSGTPGIFVQDARCLALYDALESLRRHPVRPLQRWLDPLGLGERIAFVGATSGHFASYISVERLRRLQPWLAPSIQSFSILEPLDRLVDSLNRFAPTVLASYPTAVALLGDEALAGRLRLPSLREVWTGGETLGRTVRERVQRQLGASVRNSYGASEFLAMAWECAQGHLHLNSDWVLLEPVDEHHRPVPAGEPSASVLLTHLGNTVQPLIRYDLGDQIVFSAQACGCGSALPVIEVQGRRDDTLQVAGRQGHRVALLPLALSTVLEEQAQLFDFQLCQRDDHTLLLRLPQRAAEGRQALAAARRVLQAFAQAQGAAPLKILGELGVAVPRGRSGKACRILPRREGG